MTETVFWTNSDSDSENINFTSILSRSDISKLTWTTAPYKKVNPNQCCIHTWITFVNIIIKQSKFSFFRHFLKVSINPQKWKHAILIYISRHFLKMTWRGPQTLGHNSAPMLELRYFVLSYVNIRSGRIGEKILILFKVKDVCNIF